MPVEPLPLLLGDVLAVSRLTLVLLLLASPSGPLKAAAFVLGMTLTRLLHGLLFGAVLARSPDAVLPRGGGSPVVATLLLLLGLVLLITAARTWLAGDDPDAPPPPWMTALAQWPPRQTFGLGVVLVLLAVKRWVLTLSVLGVIREAALSPAGSAGVYLLYLTLAHALLIAAVVAAAGAPQTAAATLGRARAWLTRHT